MDGYIYTNWFNTNVTTPESRVIAQRALNSLVGIFSALICGQCCYQMRYTMFACLLFSILTFYFGWLYLLFYVLFDTTSCSLRFMFPFNLLLFNNNVVIIE